MRKMKDSKIEWVGEIPETWENYKLKNLISIHFSGNWGEDPRGDENDLLCIRIADFDFGNQTIKMSANTLRHYTYSQANRLLLQDEDLLLEKSGGGEKTPVGRVVMFERCRYNGSTVFANFSECLRVNEKNVARYIAYYLKALYYNCNMRNFFTQTTGLQNLNLFKYLNVKIAMPIKYEQQRIADFLDRECERIDGLKADIEAQIETLEKYKRSVITEAVTHGLNPDAPMKDSGVPWVGEIPEVWGTMPLYCFYSERKNINIFGREQNLLSLSYGKIICKDINTSEGLLPSNYNGYNIVETDDIIIRPTDLQNDKRSLRTGLVKERGIITSAYIALKPNYDANSRYYHYLLHSYDACKVFYNMGNGVRQGLNYDEFSKLTVLVPPLDEQQAIADYLDEKCAQIDELISQKQSQLETLETYKKSLIFEYVTGKKEVV